METGHSHTPGMTHSPSQQPTQAGQASFAAVQEVVAILEADPATDWSTVNITALRGHLRDMDALMLAVAPIETQVPNGILIRIPATSPGYAAAARMVPTHIAMLGGESWTLNVTMDAEGLSLLATGEGPEVSHLRGLGFFGIMATQSHHQQHHLALALGTPMHQPAGPAPIWHPVVCPKSSESLRRTTPRYSRPGSMEPS